MLFWLFVLVLVLLVTAMYHRTFHQSHHLLSRTGKPFLEYDADGYLTDESYKSQLIFHPGGGISVPAEIIAQTKNFCETCGLPPPHPPKGN